MDDETLDTDDTNVNYRNGEQVSQYTQIVGYNPFDLPLRQDHEFRRQAWKISNQLNTKLGKLHGISHLPVLAELQTLSFMRSYPLDLMHLIYINLAPLMVKHWIGEFFPKGFLLDNRRDPYVIDSKTWTIIG